MTPPQWIKVEAGFYRLRGTPYAVASSWRQSADPDEDIKDVSGQEWAVVRFTEREMEGSPSSQDGENIDWCDTMREARMVAERLAR